jgi:hypothetical protein
MLPSTEQEDRLFGPARDETVSELKKRGVEAYDHAREAAGDVAERRHRDREFRADEPSSP